MAIGLYTLDVGHGLCQIIVFPDRRAILIDGGGAFAKAIPELFLSRFVDTLIAYVATHNDSDHTGAAIHLLDRYPSARQLEAIWLVVDRGSNSKIPLLDYARTRMAEGTIKNWYQAVLFDRPYNPLVPECVYEESAESARLDLLYPKLEDATEAHRTTVPQPRLQNRVSACLRLTVGAATGLITGDIDLVGLTRIARDYEFDLRANVLSVPHHGGHIPGTADTLSWADIIDLVQPKLSIVSSGFRPLGPTMIQKSAFEPLMKAGGHVCCTQLTKQCHTNWQSFHPGVLTASNTSGGIPQLSGSGDSKVRDAVACFGSMVITFRRDSPEVEMADLERHQRAVNERVLPHGTPYCRAARVGHTPDVQQRHA